ncbi:MAG: hypothetical protein ACHQRJ_08190, partial [Alphaproteobacteria bacterium]
SKAILAFSPASIFRLVRFVMIRSIYHDGTAHAPINPLVPNPGSTSLIPPHTRQYIENIIRSETRTKRLNHW